MRKFFSSLGLLLFLILRYPPLPRLSLFHKIEIVQICRKSVRDLALQFHWN